jgi:hypothetical protein
MPSHVSVGGGIFVWFRPGTLARFDTSGGSRPFLDRSTAPIAATGLRDSSWKAYAPWQIGVYRTPQFAVRKVEAGENTREFQVDGVASIEWEIPPAVAFQVDGVSSFEWIAASERSFSIDGVATVAWATGAITGAEWTVDGAATVQFDSGLKTHLVTDWNIDGEASVEFGATSATGPVGWQIDGEAGLYWIPSSGAKPQVCISGAGVLQTLGGEENFVF